MREDRLVDVIQRSLGRAAHAVGSWCDAYRAAGKDHPLAVANRFMKLQAAFSPPDAGFARPVGYGQAVWWGLYDAAYTRVGDFLVRPASAPGQTDGGVWFVAAQQPMLPVLCVRATRVVDFARPAAAASAGLNGYGGVTAQNTQDLALGWPASVLASGSGGVGGADLPSGAPPGNWDVLLPAIPGIGLRNGDVMRDDLGRSGVVSSAEKTDLGWRLLVKQAST
jgi:hypothetical protein